MRLLSVVLVLGMVLDAAAQESPPPPPPPQAVAAPAPPPAAAPALPPPPADASASVRASAPPLPRDAVSQWRGARALYIFGGITGLVSTGLSLSSAIYVLATGYPPDANEFIHPARPSDVGPVLAYVGSGVSALGFALSAGGLGWEHHILDKYGADPGRGLFIGGTAIGLLGLVAIGASYFFGFTNYLNSHDQSIAVLSTSLGGAALCTTGSILFSSDSTRLNRAWKYLTTF